MPPLDGRPNNLLDGERRGEIRPKKAIPSGLYKFSHLKIEKNLKFSILTT